MKVIIIDDGGGYNAVFASASETPYQILKHNNINPETRKVFINGVKANAIKIETPLSAYSKQINTIYITVKI